MKYFWLSTRGCSFDRLLLYDNRKDNLTLYRQYADLACAECSKVDELAALRISLDRSVRLASRFDMTVTGDGFFCVSDKVRNLIGTHHLSGVKSVPIPGGSFHVLIPSRFIEVDVSKAGMRIVNNKVCSLCLRPKEMVGLPAAIAMSWPKRNFDFAHPWPTPESRIGRHFRFIISEKVANLFEKGGIVGLSLQSVS